MSHIQFIVISIVFLASSVFAMPIAHAVQRTHVSAAFGADSNTATNCTAAAPCRFFQAAMTVTDNNGEVVVLDSGGYGAVTITKSLSLIAPTGVYAGISVFPGAEGITIATPGVNVTLRGISINGQGGNNGIAMTAGSKLTIDNCIISNLTQSGITVSGATTVRVTDSAIRDSGVNGITVRDGVKAIISRAIISGNRNIAVLAEGTMSSFTLADVAESTIDNNNYGVYADSNDVAATVNVSVLNSSLLDHGNYGIFAGSSAVGKATATASNNILSNNFIGLAINPGGVVWASGNTISKNGYGVFQAGTGVFESAGNNSINRNDVNASGNITNIATR